MKYSKYLSICCSLISMLVYSQAVEPSIGIKKKSLQIELESLYTIEKAGTKKHRSWSTPNTLFRYGLSNRLELQLNIPISKTSVFMNDEVIHSIHQFEDSQLGLAINLWKDKNIITEGALMVRAIFPNDLTFDNNQLGQITSLNLSRPISKSILFTVNVGALTQTDNGSKGFYIANLDYSPTEKIHFFIENQSDFDKFNAAHLNTLCGGIGFYLNKNVILDLSVASGLNRNVFYTGGILSWIIG